MSLIMYALPVFLLLIGLEILIAKRMGRKVHRLHDSVTSLNIGFISEIFRGLQKLVTVVFYAATVNAVGMFEFDLSSPLVWILAILFYDFFYYWAHRVGHEVNFAWAAHVVHHSSEEYNLTTALRQSSTNQFFYWIFYLPMAILGIPVEAFVVAAVFSAVYQFWIHTRLIPKLGWFELIFNTPSHHRVHHGQNDYCIDKNYAGTLIIWDKLFGTFAEERDNEPVIYGALTPLKSWNPLWANFKNYIGLIQNVKTAKGWRNKLMYIFAPPGWTPDSEHLSDAADPASLVLFDPAKFTLFETPAPFWQRFYGVVAIVCTLVMIFHFMLVAGGMPIPVRLAYGALIIFNAICISRIFAGTRWAVALEAVRALVVFGALMAAVWFVKVTPAIQAVAAIALLFSLALLFKVYQESSNDLQTSKRANA
jgi:alkylglycerol monooxygenase